MREIASLQREILAIQNGDLYSVIAGQHPAPACTICTQAPPGKPGQPTPKAEMIRPLRQRLDALERMLNHQQ